MSNQDHENFTIGFIVGVLAGVSGYFLTKTEEGKELRQKISKEWDDVKKKLESEGVITGNEPNFSEIVSKVKVKIFEFLDEDMPKKRKKPGPKKGSTRSSKNSENKSSFRKKMFKGI